MARFVLVVLYTHDLKEYLMTGSIKGNKYFVFTLCGGECGQCVVGRCVSLGYCVRFSYNHSTGTLRPFQSCSHFGFLFTIVVFSLVCSSFG